MDEEEEVEEEEEEEEVERPLTYTPEKSLFNFAEYAFVTRQI